MKTIQQKKGNTWAQCAPDAPDKVEVITYQVMYPHPHDRALCAECQEIEHPCGSVSHGAHMDYCDRCQSIEVRP